jgi:cytochrome c oxidase accessory protein FixG
MPAPPPLPSASRERVLPTLNLDGTRRWLRPKLFEGRFLRRRRALAWALIGLFTVLPYLRMGGKPVILLDVVNRRFILFGATFLPTDTMLLMLLLVGLFIGIFLLTAIYGRVWCGWACPQTVYMEFLYRPIERLIEGGPRAQRDLDGRRLAPRRLVKYAVFGALSMFLAHTFLAYFVGVEALRLWITRSPFEHPAAFLVMAGTTALMFLDFGWFREQVCVVACPYGRFQSVLLDRHSLIVGYDFRRGEPRGRFVRGAGNGSGAPPRALGDCIDCGACVVTCPTGIDIRDGLQMECIHCTQCIDACDAVMEKIGKPRGLIRYTSREMLAGTARHLLRPRTIIYPIALAGFLGTFVFMLSTKAAADVTLLRAVGDPFSVDAEGRVVNQVRLRIANRRSTAQRYRIEVEGAEEGSVIIPVNPFPVARGATETTSFFVTLPRSAFSSGEPEIEVHVSDGSGFDEAFDWRLLGPSRHERGGTE